MMNSKYEILVIEDGKLYQQELVEALRDSYSLVFADNGEMALKMLNIHHPHLILLDIVLPDVNGFDLLSRIKSSEETQAIPVIIITGLNEDSDEERGLLLGAVDYIKKPLNPTIVRARVRTQIQIIQHIHTIEQLSFLDALTELPNRRKFDYQIEYEWNRAIRKKTPLSLLMMDLDNFKAYNDRYGHSQGDSMLQSVAKVLKKSLKRSIDIPCRWGGEEFAVLLPETETTEALEIAERIRTNIEAYQVRNISDNSVTSITVSIGVCTAHPVTDQPLSAFINDADKLLYEAKEGGRNRVVY